MAASIAGMACADDSHTAWEQWTIRYADWLTRRAMSRRFDRNGVAFRMSGRIRMHWTLGCSAETGPASITAAELSSDMIRASLTRRCAVSPDTLDKDSARSRG